MVNFVFATIITTLTFKRNAQHVMENAADIMTKLNSI